MKLLLAIAIDIGLIWLYAYIYGYYLPLDRNLERLYLWTAFPALITAIVVGGLITMYLWWRTEVEIEEDKKYDR